MVVERFSRELAVFAGSGGSLSSKEGVGGCEMTNADELEAPDALLLGQLGEGALRLVALSE